MNQYETHHLRLLAALIVTRRPALRRATEKLPSRLSITKPTSPTFSPLSAMTIPPR